MKTIKNRQDEAPAATLKVEALLKRLQSEGVGDANTLVEELDGNLQHEPIENLSDFMRNAVACGYVLAVHHSLCPEYSWGAMADCKLYAAIRATLGADDVPI